MHELQQFRNLRVLQIQQSVQDGPLKKHDVRKTDEFCMKNEKLCIKNEEFCM